MYLLTINNEAVVIINSCLSKVLGHLYEEVLLGLNDCNTGPYGLPRGGLHRRQRPSQKNLPPGYPPPRWITTLSKTSPLLGHLPPDDDD